MRDRAAQRDGLDAHLSGDFGSKSACFRGSSEIVCGDKRESMKSALVAGRKFFVPPEMVRESVLWACGSTKNGGSNERRTKKLKFVRRLNHVGCKLVEKKLKKSVAGQGTAPIMWVVFSGFPCGR